jgi:uncharacterized membrane protein YbhN (UPF0104 family)
MRPRAVGAGGPASRWRPVGGVAILAVLLATVGLGPVGEALRSVDAKAVVAATAIAAVTTTSAAVRWRVVARRLGVELSLPAAVTGCYRAQFLNSVLPGGVVGDVGRGVSHGRAVDDVGRGLRAVAWERSSGFVVLLGVALLALLAAPPSSVPWSAVPVWVPVAAAGVVVGTLLMARAWAPARFTRVVAGTSGDVRALLAPSAALPIVASSIVVLAGHVATFAVAVRAAGVAVDAADLVPVALIVLVLAAVPLNFAGWGPREGAAVWAFADAGLGASTGLTVAVVYGAIALLATLPGALLLVVGRRKGAASPTAPGPHRGALPVAVPGGAADG